MLSYAELIDAYSTDPDRLVRDLRDRLAVDLTDDPHRYGPRKRWILGDGYMALVAIAEGVEESTLTYVDQTEIIGTRVANDETGGIMLNQRPVGEPLVWFLMWTCGCTTPSRTTTAIAARCPEHDAEQAAAPDRDHAAPGHRLGRMTQKQLLAEAAAR